MAATLRKVGPPIAIVVADYCEFCADTGHVGRDPEDGGPLFCICGTGLRANLDYLSDLMQNFAEQLARLDATAKVRALTPFELGARQAAQIVFDGVKDEYDRVEAEYRAMRQRIPF